MTSKKTQLILVLMGLMAFSSLISCTRTVELPTVTKQRNTSPGADGRIVIWIDPIKAKKGELSSVEKQLVEKINELDPNSDTDRLALLTHLDDERWFVRREVIVVLGESNDPKVLLNLVPSTRDPHWIVANESSGQLLSKQTAIRSKVFELGIESDQASLRNITARSWSVLVDSNRLQIVDDPILITEFLKSSCRLFSSEQMASYGPSGDPAILSLVESCTISAKGLKTATPVAILRAIQSASPRIVFAGAFSIFRCGTLIASEHIESLLVQLERSSRTAEGELEIVIAVARAVLGQPSALGLLANRLKAETFPNHLWALDYLLALTKRISRIRHPDLSEGLAVSLENDDSEIRRRAAEIAGLSGDARMVIPLTRGLKDDDSQVRARCAYSLGQLNAASAVHALVERGLEDLSSQVNDASYVALHHIAHGIALPPYALIAEWLNGDGSQQKETFWGRDHDRWRRWYQLER